MNNYQIATFDIEASDWIYPICLGFYDGEIYKIFYSKNCISDFLDFLFASDKYKKYKIYAHYGGVYDFLFLIDELYKRDLLEESNIILINGNIAKLGINKFNFLDSKHLLLNSLEKLTTAFNTKHKKLPEIDVNNILKYSKHTIEKYVKYDTIGLYEVLIKFYDNLYKNFGIYPSLTIAATSMQSFKNQNKYNIFPITNMKIDKFIRSCYYGGRVEIFKIYGKNLYYYDYNSLYPFVMINNKFPVGNYIEIGGDWEQYLSNNSKFLGYGKFKVSCPTDLNIPLLPCRHNNKLLFPTGDFEGYYSFNEIKKALSIGYEVELLTNKNKEYEGYICKWNKHIFDKHILNLYKQKQYYKIISDNANYLIYKIKANALGGKFGEKKIREKYLFSINPKNILDVRPYTENPPIYIMEEEINKNYHNVGIAVEMTTYARLKLFEEIENIESLGYNIYYVDTDSLITNCPPEYLKVDNLRIGYLKLENYYSKKDKKVYIMQDFEGLFIAPKFYMINLPNKNTLFKHKGFKSINLTFNQLKELHYTNNLHKIKTVDISINRFKESLKRINVEHRKSIFLSTKKLPKSIKSSYDKRLVSGNNTFPINLSFQ